MWFLFQVGNFIDFLIEKSVIYNLKTILSGVWAIQDMAFQNDLKAMLEILLKSEYF